MEASYASAQEKWVAANVVLAISQPMAGRPERRVLGRRP